VGDLVFLYFPSRAGSHVREGLGDSPVENGVLLSDGSRAYARNAEHTGLTHAQCWSHTRRLFERAKNIEPEASAEALTRIGELYV